MHVKRNKLAAILAHSSKGKFNEMIDSKITTIVKRQELTHFFFEGIELTRGVGLLYRCFVSCDAHQYVM